MNGIVVAVIVRNCTFASSGSPAMKTAASAASLGSNVGSGLTDPSGCGAPAAIGSAIAVWALPMSIWPQAMLYGRPSSEIDLVRPVIPCLVTVYPTERGRGVWAEIEPLLMIRPPAGRCAFIIATAWCAHRNEPVRLVATIDCQPSGVTSSTAPP